MTVSYQFFTDFSKIPFFTDVQDMLRQFEDLLSDKLAISADKDTLKDQVSDFEPLYQEIMGKEHEIIMLINRGRDVIAKAKKSDANPADPSFPRCITENNFQLGSLLAISAVHN